MAGRHLPGHRERHLGDAHDVRIAREPGEAKAVRETVDAHMGDAPGPSYIVLVRTARLISLAARSASRFMTWL